MNILKKIVCGVCAVVMCFGGLEIKADADAFSLDTYSIGAYYVVNTDGVHSCQNSAYVGGYTDEWNTDEGHGNMSGLWFNTGDVVYVETGYYSSLGAAAGITWGNCSSDESDFGSWYGWVDMRYLTPYDEYYAQTEPPTEATTTTTTTTKVTTTKKTTTATTTLTTTTTEIQTTTTETVPAVVHKSSGGFFKNNFALLIVGAIVALLACSAALAVFLIFKSKKKQGQQYVQPMNINLYEQNSGVRFCPKCGEQHGENAVFCRKCGTKL
ncbi:MAG: zinc ribbon domain-containing protein [Oscillospiraceae bacterium]|nr:zinc ribbon domain-containing protein [Oscillospiraceae bacterium]